MKIVLIIVILLLVLAGCGTVEQPMEVIVEHAEETTESPVITEAVTAEPTTGTENVSTEPSVYPVPTRTLKPKPTPTPDMELIDTAEVPSPKEGQWFESDIVGNYQITGMYYSDEEDLLIRAKYGDCIVVSKIDGSDKRILVQGAGLYEIVLYYKGWIYYMYNRSPWKIKLNGDEKQQISEIQGLDIFIYNDILYLMDPKKLYSIGLDGENEIQIDLPGNDQTELLFENGYGYYRTNRGDDNGDIIRYNLTTGEAEVLSSGNQWPGAVKDNWVYYGSNDAIFRTDGESTEKLATCKRRLVDFNIYRNYLLYFDEGVLYALDIYTLNTYKLSDRIDERDILSMENSVFISGYYHLTFHDDLTETWELNWIYTEPDNRPDEQGD